MASRLAIALIGLSLAIGTSFAEAQTTEPRRFDLVSVHRDLNGLMSDPSWADSTDPHSLDPVKDCGMLGLHGSLGFRHLLLRDSSCFSPLQRGILRLNESRDVRLGGVICSQPAEDGSLQGHVNWFPVTMTGILRYAGSLRGSGGDYDLTFELVPNSAQRWPLTRWNWNDKSDPKLGSIHIEFDVRETTYRVPNRRTYWWHTLDSLAGDSTYFQRLAGLPDDSIEAAVARRVDAYLGTRKAIVTGLFNLDAVHQGHAELHPVYALMVLVHVDTVAPLPGGSALGTSALSEIREQWAFMVRDRGNEGNCAAGIVPFHFGADSDAVNEYRFLIDDSKNDERAPRIEKALSPVVAHGARIEGPFFRWARGQGLEVAVRWPKPLYLPKDVALARSIDDALMMGTITLARFGTPGEVSDTAGQGARAIPISRLGPGTTEEETKVVRGKAKPRLKDLGEFEDNYYRLLSPLDLHSNWSNDLIDTLSLSQASDLEPAASESYDVIPPVLFCNQVHTDVNPRCLGTWALAPFFGRGLEDPALDHRTAVSAFGIGFESPGLLFHNLHIRPGLMFSLRRPQRGAPTEIHSQQRWAAQLGGAAGPWRTLFGGAYLVGNLEGVLVHDDRGDNEFVGLSLGAGVRPRNGYQLDLAIEALATFTKHMGTFWIIGFRTPFVLPR